MITNIQKWGNSQGVRIPKILLDTVNWSENEQIILLVQGDKIVMEKAKEKKQKKKNIKELFADYQKEYEPIDIDWGDPEGNEI